MPSHFTSSVPQHGSALVIGLVVLGVMSAVGATAANYALDREKAASGYRQQVDAMQAAEYGVMEARSGLQAWIANNNAWPTLNQAEALLGADWHQAVSQDHLAQQFRVSQVSPNGPDQYIFDIEGAVRNGSLILSRRTLQITLARQASGSPPILPFADGVVGCAGVQLTGGAAIDSFNSNDGSYGATLSDGSTNSQTDEVRVRTILAGAPGSFSGHAPIYGDVALTGDVSMNGSTPIYGNLHADGGGGTLNGTVTGSVSVGGSVTFGSASNVQGHVSAGGDVTVSSTSNPPPSISAAGSVSYPSWWQYNPQLAATSQQYAGSQQGLAIPQAYDASIACDPLQIVNPENGLPGDRFSDIWNDPDTDTLADYFQNAGCPQCSSSDPNAVALTGGIGNQPAEHTVIGAPGSTTKIRVDNNLTTNGRLQTLTIQGDVTLVVDGGFNIGGATQLNVAPDANLTLLVTGQTTLGAGSNVLTDANGGAQPFVRNGKPAFSVYSAYQSGQGQPGVTVSGANNSHVSVYAPNTEVRMTGSGEVYGAVRAGHLVLSGSGDIHYDSALGAVVGGTNPGAGGLSARVTSWWDAR